jgi:hypothetical protein
MSQALPAVGQGIAVVRFGVVNTVGVVKLSSIMSRGSGMVTTLGGIEPFVGALAAESSGKGSTKSLGKGSTFSGSSPGPSDTPPPTVGKPVPDFEVAFDGGGNAESFDRLSVCKTDFCTAAINKSASTLF